MYDDASEARAAGIAHGWDAANYADAYGHDPADVAPERGRVDLLAPVLTETYLDAFDDGAERYSAGQWSDGTPIAPLASGDRRDAR